MHIKKISHSLLWTFALTFLLVVQAHAIDFGGLKDKAAAATESAGGSELANIGKSLYSAFSGNELATKYAKGIVNSLQTGQYSQVFDFYNKLKKAGLSPTQLTSWNGIKNTISAFVLENGIDSVDKPVADLIARTSKMLKSNETGTAMNYLKKLGSLDTLSKSETSLVSKIQSNLLPLVLGQ
jgi:hypothetical protein